MIWGMRPTEGGGCVDPVDVIDKRKVSVNRGVRRAMMVISDDQALLFNVHMRNGLAMVKERFSLRAILSNGWSLATTRALTFNVNLL